MKKINSVLLSVIVLSSLIIFCASTPAAAKTERVSLASFPPGSSWYAMMVAMSQAINKYSDVASSVIPTTAVSGFYQMLKTGKADIIMVQSSSAWHVWSGKGGGDWTGLFPDPKEAYQDMRLLMGTNNNYYGYLTGDFTGIKTIPGLKGKKVGRIFPTIPATNYSRVQLEAYGLDPEKDVISLKYPFTTHPVADLGEKKIDAAFTSMGGAKVLEVNAKVGALWLPFDKDKVSYLKKLEPWIDVEIAPTYIPGVEKEISAMYLKNFVLCKKSLPDEIALKIVKAVTEHIQESASSQWELKQWGRERVLVPDFFIPYHPGAVKYLKSAGIWNSATEEKQLKLLADLPQK
ncbi:MAG: TAXI family TRAP transporter solute-binding subunit [Desulfobacterales bacterium]|nr:TAXI family TRAP transporter solute-binding subunit [Desulfobacterales bacterium]